MDTMDDKEARIILERMGAEQVRLLLPSNLGSDLIPYAAKWLGEKDEAERLRSRVAQANTQMAAWIAAAAAIIAVAVTVVAWLFPRLPPH